MTENQRLPRTTATHHRLESDAELTDLMAAYQVLQSQNARMANGLSAQLGVGPTGLRVILYLDHNANATPKEVALKLEQTSGSVTSVLDRLERSGHITRRPHPRDRRSLTLSLTVAGRSVAIAIRDAYQTAFADVFSPDEIGRAAAILHALAGSMDSKIDALNSAGRAVELN